MQLTAARLRQLLDTLPATTGYWIAYSGGRDSHVLLHLLHLLGRQLGVPLSALHVDHGLQPGSADWGRHCVRICQQLGLSCKTLVLDLSPQPGVSTEALAREARYRALFDQVPPGGTLLTAHHQDDQAETVLLQLLRGAGPSGLSAMPLHRVRADGRYHARPLLQVPAEAVAEYATRNGLQWLDDPSNAVTGFDRNYLRHQVLPRLRSRFRVRSSRRLSRGCNPMVGSSRT